MKGNGGSPNLSHLYSKIQIIIPIIIISGCLYDAITLRNNTIIVNTTDIIIAKIFSFTHSPHFC